MKNIQTGDRFRGYFITVNEKTMTDLALTYENMLSFFERNKLTYEYLAFDEERGKAGNEHLHIYVEFFNPRKFSVVKNLFKGAHIEPRRTNPAMLRNYIAKPKGIKWGKMKEEKNDTVIKPIQEYGSFERLSNIGKYGSDNSSVKETSAEKFKRYVETYNSIDEVIDEDVYFAKMFRRELEERFLAKKEQALFERIGKTKVSSNGNVVELLNRKVYYLQGDSRVGKTFGIKLKYGSANVYVTTAEKNFFDDYNGQRVLNLDDFHSEMNFKEFLTVLQTYRTDNIVSARYANKRNLSEVVIVSSNLPIENQYLEIKCSDHASFQAFINRFTAGIWEMVYSPKDDERYICCISTPYMYSAAARKELDFSEPPVCLDEVTWIDNVDDFNLIKAMIKAGRSTSKSAIRAEKKKRAKERAEATKRAAKRDDGDLPF